MEEELYEGGNQILSLYFQKGKKFVNFHKMSTDMDYNTSI